MNAADRTPAPLSPQHEAEIAKESPAVAAMIRYAEAGPAIHDADLKVLYRIATDLYAELNAVRAELDRVRAERDAFREQRSQVFKANEELLEKVQQAQLERGQAINENRTLTRERDELKKRVAELEALTPAPVQTCRVCGAGYMYGEPCSTCEFRERMAAESADEPPHPSPCRYPSSPDCTCGGAR